MKTFGSAKELLNYLNTTYAKLHTTYEDYFWLSYMGDHSYNEKKDIALKKRDEFRNNEALYEQVKTWLQKSKGESKGRLSDWQRFFSLYQVPSEGKDLKAKIAELETKIEKNRSSRKEGYIDPKSKKFVAASVNKMRSMITTEESEVIRKACFDAVQVIAAENVSDYIELVLLRNAFAKTLGYEDFFAYKLAIEEKMTKKELFSLFDTLYEKTKYGFKNIRALEKNKPGLRKPWNFSYMMAGSFTKEENPYFPFEEALVRWGRSFAAMGIDYKGGKLVLDLLDRKGKYNNGFCHWPDLVSYKDGKKIPGRSQFTCNVVLDIPGQSNVGMVTLFHEGGHAAHMLSSEMKDVCVNHEYAPMSTAWAETQSMFLDTVFSSIEWTSRYAITAEGAPYPIELYERKLKAVEAMQPLDPMGILRVPAFEKMIYEEKTLTKEKVLAFAKKVGKKYFDFNGDTLMVLEVPHIYSWESSCSYQGYLLAELALAQWRACFYKKYGYIVDNPAIGKEMQKVWKYGGSKTFPEFVKLATGKKLSPDSYIKSITRSVPQTMKLAKDRIETLSKKAPYKKVINLNASIKMVHGKQTIADNKKSFEDMAEKYAKWLKTQYSSKV